MHIDAVETTKSWVVCEVVCKYGKELFYCRLHIYNVNMCIVLRIYVFDIKTNYDWVTGDYLVYLKGHYLGCRRISEGVSVFVGLNIH